MKDERLTVYDIIEYFELTKLALTTICTLRGYL